MPIFTRILCPVVLTLLAPAIAADHMNIADWEISAVLEKIPEPNACDLATAHEYDPLRTVRDGVPYADIDAQQAIAACQPIANRVLEKYKTERPYSFDQIRDLRAIYQLSRAISKSGDDAQALKINHQARDLGYPYSYFYEYSAYTNGWGTARNPKRAATRLAQAVDRNVPIAHQTRAEIELTRDAPNFPQIIDDLGRAEKGYIPVALTWARVHEKMGEQMLISNQSCVAGHCGKKIADMGEYEMLFTFNYHGLRAYYGALESALNFYHDYIRSHPTSETAIKNIDRIEDRLEMLNPMIKSKLDDLYRPHPQ